MPVGNRKEIDKPTTHWSIGGYSVPKLRLQVTRGGDSDLSRFKVFAPLREPL